MKKVYIIAPLGGDVAANIERAKIYARYAFERGTTPVVPHFYALILDDDIPEQRTLGLRAGQSLLWLCDEAWVFCEQITPGMQGEIQLAEHLGIRVRYYRQKERNGGKEFYETKKYC